MHRRHLISGIGTAFAAGLAGCGGFLGNSGPQATVEDYAKAVNENDEDGIDELIHPESPRQNDPFGMMMLDEIEIELHELETTKQEEKEAVVKADMTVTGMGLEDREQETFELQKSEGEWKIW
ncbi:hypothetical protein K0C01_07185 [Salinarchaeum sp. IM2453]|uniref:hypothetical protein n=1 Tax=Salinarchaeum sp. IM2453 TaxID=2862870 RepID=UPI001C82F85C|nr:hypothetical protein [Salinarchaeum sp. IM2453]QZA87596.1 hypothetical protein K0C01_07185 [Salinarchaeum sp. IM2453]